MELIEENDVLEEDGVNTLIMFVDDEDEEEEDDTDDCDWSLLETLSL